MFDEAVPAGALFDAELPATSRTALASALDALRAVSEAKVVGEGPAGSDKTAVDVEVALPGGGRARYEVQVARQPSGAWRVVSIQGAGVAWPPGPAPKDEGLTTSPPPGAGREGGG